MSHAVETMFSGSGRVPWHKLGVVVPDGLPLEEAWRTAGLDWRVDARPIYAYGGETISGYRAITRATDGRVFGVVSDEYCPIQNHEVFELAEACLQAGATFETAGALFGGRIVWALARTEGFCDALTGDRIDPYLLIHTGHDGLHKLRVSLNPVRVVCANTLSQAIAAQQRGIAIVHRKGWRANIEEARRILGLARDVFGQFSENLAHLATIDLEPHRATIIDRMIPEAKPDAKSIVRERTTVARFLFESCVNNPKGCEHGRGTLYQAWNGLAEYADHFWPVHRQTGLERDRAERRMADLTIGNGPRSTFKERGFALLQELAS